MQLKTYELLCSVLWACDKLAKPTWRNLDEPYEQWLHRTGLDRRIKELIRKGLLEHREIDGKGSYSRIVRLTEAGRVQALGGRDPQACWNRRWDGKWRIVLFDVEVSKGRARDKFRRYLRARGFGCLQRSAWISPHALAEEQEVLAGDEMDVSSLIMIEGRPCGGETDQEIVAAAWDFADLNRRYQELLQLLGAKPAGEINSESEARRFRDWFEQERDAWRAAISSDPLLPKPLLPLGYLGCKTWRERQKVLADAVEQIQRFRGAST